MKSLSHGILIVLEGIDGSGKSTLARTLFDTLKNNSFPVLLTKEPGGSPLGNIVRPCLQEQQLSICPQAEFLLFAADRAQHFQEVVIPALDNNMIVISDRMADSSLVYQGYGRGLNRTMLENINSWAMQTIKPDLIFYLKIDYATALQRIQQRNHAITRFEKDHLFLQKTVDGFDELYTNRSDVITLNAQESLEAIQTKAQQYLIPFLNAHLV